MRTTLRFIVNSVAFFATLTIFSQSNLYSSLTIPENLAKNANAVIRSNNLVVSMASSKEMTIALKRIITVLNKSGDDYVGAYVNYDDNIKVKDLNVVVFDAMGNQIKKIKKNDFFDVSAVDGGTLYTDSRAKFLRHTPIGYPYTIEFNYEIETDNTAFINPFTPIHGYHISIENSSYTLNYPETITIRKKENNFENINLIKEETSNKLFYKVENIEALKPEDYSPSFDYLAPRVLFASKQFALKGEEGEAESWGDFGKWMYEDLVKDAYDLTPETIHFIQDLVKDIPNNIDKAKKIYQYMQDKTRYISVQVGIGGWKPFNASEVDRLGYGDCKALSNYTMSLFKAANIESYCTILYAGENQRNIDKDFVSMQGNHMILYVPSEKENLWLECTSQKVPFGFIGDFTDDRDVMVITPTGGEIKHTKKYTTEENSQKTNGNYSVSNDGGIHVKVKVVSEGIQYDDKYRLESVTPRNLDVHYKKHWKYLNNINIENIQILNDKELITFTESIDFNATNYIKILGDRMLFTVNALNRSTYVPDRYKDRKWPVKIYRGFKDVDEVEISLPDEYKVESLPKTISIENKFGNYHAEFIVKDENTLIYKRQFVVNDGDFPKEDYEAFRNFYKDVAKQDYSKIALIKTNP